MAATVLAPRAVAQPMAASADRGDLAMVPYYTVRGQWVTGIHIVNTSNKTQVVKFRFRRATDGMDALDFNIVMSPEDVYAGFLSDDENGAISWSSPDTTCTVPATQANRLTMPPIYRVGAESGYVEIIAMGQAETEQQPIAVAARHSGATATPPLTPLNCEAVRSNFFADGTGAANPGVQNNRTTHQRAVPSATNRIIRAGGANTYADSGNVLKVSYFIRDNATGIEFGDNAVHIQDFLSAPTITNQQYGLISGDLNGFDFPDLDGTGLPRNAAAGTIVRNRFNRLRRRDVLGVDSIINEWSVNPANGVQMDWVVTLPGQYLMLRLPQYRASLASDGAWVPTVNSAGSPVQNPKCPRRAIPANPSTGAAEVSSCDYRDMPVKLTYEAYNREEFKAVDESQLVVSPQAPTETSTFLPKVANVITFGGNSVLGQTDTNVNANLGQPFGWVNAQLGPQSNAHVCEWDSTQDAVSPAGTTVTAGQALTLNCLLATGQVPVIGFAAWARKVAANPNASYGRIVEHSYRVPAPGAPTPQVPVPGAPTNLGATAGDTQVALSWTAVPGATSYTVYYSTSPITSLTAAGVTAVPNLTATSHIVTSLLNGTLYYFVVTATTAGGEGAASSEASATPAAPTAVPGAPTNLGATAGNTQVALSWTAVPGATSYTVYYSTSPITSLTAAGVTAVRNLTATSHIVTSLLNGTLYYFVVTATTAGGEGAASSEASATPAAPTAVPGAPTNLGATAGNTQVALSWTAVPGATSYTVYYSTSPITSLTAAGVTAVPNLTATSHIVTSLLNGTLYYFVVTATTAGGEGAASSEASATPAAPTAVPGAPTNLGATAGDTQVALSWTAVPGATSYTVYYSTSPITSLTAAGVTAVPNLTATSHIVTSLLNGTLYYFVVTATTAGGEGAASSEASATPAAPTAVPGAPTNLGATAGDTQVALSWTAVPGATSYTVYYSTSPITSLTAAGVTAVRNLTATSHIVTSLLNGTLYYFVVTATTAGGEGAASSEASATPAAPTAVPGAPTNLGATAGDTQVALSWTAVPGATSYTVYYSTSPITSLTAAGVTAVRNLTATSHIVTSLLNGTLYYFVVTATTAGGEGAASSEASATPAAPTAVPGAPTNLGATAGNTQVALSWTAVPGATSYTVYYSTSPITSLTAAGVTAVPNLTATSHIVTSLLNGTLYYFVVTATTAGGEGAASSEASATPAAPTAVPGAPTNLGATAGDTQVALSWTAVPGATSYTVYYSTSPITSLTAAGVTAVPNLTATSHIVTSLLNGTLYYFVVTATTAGGEGAASSEASATPAAPTAVPGAPTNLGATAGDTQVALSWTAVPGATSYTVYYSTSPITSLTAAGVTAVRNLTATSHIVTSLLNGTLYYFVVTATTAGGEGAASSEASATPAAPTAVPGAPTNLGATAGDTQVALSWTAVPGATSYTVYYSTSPITSLTAAGVTAVRNLTATSHIVTSLLNGTLYYFVVTAINAGGEGAASSEASATPAAPTAVPGAPTNLGATAGNTQVALSWTAVPGATSYTVYYSTSPITSLTAAGVTAVRNLTATSHIVTSLLNGTLYYFVVTAINAGGEGAASSEASATPQATVRISGRLTFDLVPITNRGLDYSNITRAPIRGVLVEAVNASGTVLASTSSDSNGNYSLSVAPNTQVRIRVRAHMQQTGAGAPRWDIKVTDNTNSNALYTFQGSLSSSGTGSSTRDLHAASGWVPSGTSGSYANTRVAGPFAILSFTYDALQKFVMVDADMNLPALEYRWSTMNRQATPMNLTNGALGGKSFYRRSERVIYLLGRENEDTEEYDQSVVMHEFAHHVHHVMSRNDSIGDYHTLNARLDMRLAFSEGFANALGSMIADDPIFRDSFGSGQATAGGYNNETNPVNPTSDPNRIGWYHSYSVAAILYDLYDGTNTADNDALSLGLAPIYNTLISKGFKNNRYYTSIYLFANQLLQNVPAASRATTQTSLNALLRRHNIFGRGDNGAGETNSGGLPSSARVLPVYKSLSTRNSPITLCSVNGANGTYPPGYKRIGYNRLGNRAFVEVSFAESGSHTLTMTSTAASKGTRPGFLWRPYPGDDSFTDEVQWSREPTSNTVTGNFQAREPLVLEAADWRNIDNDPSNNGDSCFTFSVAKNP